MNETFVGSFYVGDKQVFVDEWSQRIEHESERGFETREFIRGSCIPFKNTFIGEATEGGTKGGSGYVDLRWFQNSDLFISSTDYSRNDVHYSRTDSSQFDQDSSYYLKYSNDYENTVR